ncbi:hypothetical protein GPECTOR_2g1579 [Gonium pectorale]|uniref:Uncharacterized protein n=1 Tax=Gonium pectorale TaxID=33097 RepID=A0A150H1K1_GONPE|nr:hypothetical protein GPECTOR_2g1579 [Gonium pectorale]|eukprot:KXZ56027.1 hypothetical protein GPECTOR_2g1579 [Gonium pectorale]
MWPAAAGSSSLPPARWCEPQELLASVVGFCHLPASQLRSDGDVEALCKLVGRFAQALQDRSAFEPHVWPGLSPGDARSLQLAAAALTSRSGTAVTWFPEYGCALLALGPPGGAGLELDDVVLERGGVCTGPQHPGHLVREALAHLHLWLLRRQLALLQPATATPIFQTAVSQMLQSAAEQAAALADDGYNMAAFEAACRDARTRLVALVGERALSAARTLELPTYGSAGFQGTLAPPVGALPTHAAPRAEENGVAAARWRASRNLGALPLLRTGAAFADVLQQLEDPQWAQPGADDDIAAQLALRSVERELFRRAAQGFDASSNRLDQLEVEALEAVVDAYRAAVQRFLRTPAAAAVMRVELRSRELLVVWVAYCLTHAAAAREHPLLLRYGCLENYADLRHLVLSDAKAVNAALSVAAYLQAHSRAGCEVFSLRDGGAASRGLAQQFAAACPRLTAILAAEQSDAEARVAGHWREVRRKQRLAAELREELRGLKAEGADLAASLRLRESELSSAQYTYSHYGYTLDRMDAVSRAQAKVNTARSRVSANSAEQSRVTAELTQAERAPQAVIQPLPEGPDLARQWLFFLHMPSAFRRLSRASFLAQQMLLPRPISGALAKAIGASFATGLVDHYNRCRGDDIYHGKLRQRADGADGEVMLMSHQLVPHVKTVGPHHVDDCRSSRDGVWYPDGLVACMAWGGSGAAADAGQGFPPTFDPFTAVEARIVELYFTERLPAASSALQWAMDQHRTAADTPATRGNVALATQGGLQGRTRQGQDKTGLGLAGLCVCA